MSLDTFIRANIFSVLVFWHFLADWVFQSHKEALAKAKDHAVRGRHCAVYAVLFFPLLCVIRVWDSRAIWCIVILWVSHFIIDTYWPVMMWAKYLRRAPQFAEVRPPFLAAWKEFIEQPIVPTPSDAPEGWQDKVIDHPNHRKFLYETDGDAFKAIFATPVGAILCIVMDQFLHCCFLLPVAYMIATH